MEIKTMAEIELIEAAGYFSADLTIADGKISGYAYKFNFKKELLN